MNQERTSKQLEHRSATEATYRKKMRMKKVMETHLKYVLCKDENDPGKAKIKKKLFKKKRKKKKEKRRKKYYGGLSVLEIFFVTRCNYRYRIFFVLIVPLLSLYTSYLSKKIKNHSLTL